MTLSANDRGWNDLMKILLKIDQGGRNISDIDVLNLSDRDRLQATVVSVYWYCILRNELIRKYPTQTMEHFYYRIDMAWKHILKSPAKPLGESSWKWK